MAIAIHYFAARSDEEAAATVNLPTGPGDDDIETVPAQDVDPGLALGYLNELLTGVSVEDFVGRGWPALVAVSADEQKYVLQVDPGFVALMTTREAPFRDIAQKWAEVKPASADDDWAPRVRDLDDFLTAFVPFCFQALDEGKHIYCWLWP